MKDPMEKKVIHKGKAYFSVLTTSQLLHTTSEKVRDLMSQGALDWAQLKDNGKPMVTAASIADYMKRNPDQTK